MTGLTWLHLSDWHQGAEKYQKLTGFDRSVVGRKLIEDIINRANFLGAEQSHVDFIVFSGDVAFSGIVDEYEAAKVQLFEPLLKATGLKSDRLFIIPGNHDLSREAAQEFAPAELQIPLQSPEQVQKWLTTPKRLEKVLEPFEAYRAFTANYSGQPSPDYATIQEWTINGQKISLVGLNSAWMCGRNKNT